MIVLDAGAELAGHVATALRMHRTWATRARLRIPDGFADLEQAFTAAARRGQEGTALEDLWALSERAPVPPRLLTLDETATALSCSVRQVRRLVAAGHLTAVRVGAGTTRVRVTDVDAYVAGLPATREDAA